MRALGVLLAAGTGSRFEGSDDDRSGDDNKLLAAVAGEPVVVRAARTLVDASERAADAGSIDDVVAVLGHEADRVEAALSGLDVEAVRNPDYETGQATSVARGAALARDWDADAVVFALGDMPCVRPDTVRAVVEAFARTDDAHVAVPVHDGRRGNPAVFGSRHFDALASLTGDRGGRTLFEAHPVERVPVDDPGVHLDVDTVADLRRARNLCGSREPG